jgi:hypothetical protein
MGTGYSLYNGLFSPNRTIFTKNAIDESCRIFENTVSCIRKSGWKDASTSLSIRISDASALGDSEYHFIGLGENSRPMNPLGIIDGDDIPIVIHYYETFPIRKETGNGLLLIFDKGKEGSSTGTSKMTSVVDCGGLTVNVVSEILKDKLRSYNKRFAMFCQKTEFTEEGDGLIQDRIDFSVKSNFVSVNPRENNIMIVWAESIENVPLRNNQPKDKGWNTSGFYSLSDVKDTPILIYIKKTENGNRTLMIACNETAEWGEYQNVYLHPLENTRLNAY